jgi:tetratricopeptide (TPR) repeat protein
MNRRNRRAGARKLQVNSNDPGANSPAALYETGLRHMRAGQYPDAQICCQQALAIDSNHAGILHLMGLLSLQVKQYDLAVEWIARAIRKDPNPLYIASLGTTLWQQGRREEALKAFDKAVQLKPDDAELWKNLGNILVELERPADALLTFQHVLKLKPHHWDAAKECGILLHKLGRLEEALSYFSLCDGIRPNQVPTLQMRVICLDGLKRFEEALTDTRRAQALDPTNADLCNNVGIALRSLCRDEEALEWFDRALKLRSNFTDALHNKAVSLTTVRQLREAFTVYDCLKTADPNDALAELGLAHLHILTGNFEAGWAGREARWKIPSTYPKFPQPMWLGNGTLEGKTILIGADEGFGDTIQFARYVPMVAERGARVVLVVQDPLHLLMSGLPGLAQCIPISATKTNTLPAFDLHCPMMSLPLAFGTKLDTVPAPASYLPRPTEARVQAWEDRLGTHDRLRVGLVWSGNPKHRNDHNRSLPLRALTRIFDADATFVSLQKDPNPNDTATLLERADIVELTAHLTDFTETAALVTCLDLVITVDTSVAHLSAALGCPTWMLLPYMPDYRWMLDRDDSPWYPTMRLFRQTATREYANVLDRVRAELLARISTFGAASE